MTGTCSSELDTLWGPGVDVLGWNRPVQLEEDARVGGLVGAGEGDKSAVGVDSAGAAGDVDLGACDVDLDTTNAGGAVQSDVLHAEEVLAVLDAAGNGDRYGLLAIAGPLEVAGAKTSRTVLVDLEPDRTLAVESRGSLASGDLSQIELERSRVADVAVDIEGEGTTGRDGDSLGCTTAGRLLVAGHGLRVDVLNGAVRVLVLGGANRRPVGRDRSTALDESREGVVSLGGGNQPEGNRGSELHIGWFELEIDGRPGICCWVKETGVRACRSVSLAALPDLYPRA